MTLERSSSPAVEDGATEPTYADVVQRGRLPERESFQTQVLSLLGSLRIDMQSMVTDLERQRAQSALPTTPKGKGKGKVPPCGANREATTSAACALSWGTRRSAEDGANDDEARMERLWSTSQAEESSMKAPHKHWADRDNEVMDYDEIIVWDDEEEELADTDTKGIRLFKVAERTEKFLESVFSSAIPNTTRRKWREKYGAPNTTATACQFRQSY